MQRHQDLNLGKLATYVLASLIIAILLFLSFEYGYNQGKVATVDYIIANKDIMRHLASKQTMAELEAIFPQKLNYTDLLIWEGQNLTYTQNRDFHTDPLEIIRYGKGACGEFTFVYVALCLANGIPARLVGPGYSIPNVVDHAWAEIVPSKDGQWMHVDPTDACASFRKGEGLDEVHNINNTLKYAALNYKLVVAYQTMEDGSVAIIDRTTIYSPNI